MKAFCNTIAQLLKKLPALSLSFIFVFVFSAALACGPGLFEDDARFCLFRPSTINYPQLSAMQYSQKLFHYFNPEDFESENTINCKKWQQVTGKTVSYNDIFNLQYHTSPDSFLAAYQAQKWENFNGNSFVKWLAAKKNRRFLEYFAIAKAIEKTQTITNEGWGYYFHSVETNALDSLKQVCYTRYKKKLPAFLRLRYGFQFLKCAYYAVDPNDQPKIDEVFKTLAAGSSITSQWAYIYYALLQQDNLQQAHYLVKAFDICDAKKYRAFSLLSVATLDTLASTTGDHYIRVMARAIAAMKNPGRSLQDIQFVFDNDPANKYLPLLITREINKLEDWLYSPEVLYFQPFLAENYFTTTVDDPVRYNFEYDKKYLEEFLEQLLRIQRFKSTTFLNIAVAHLYNMSHQHSSARDILFNMEEPVVKEERISFLLEKLFTIVNSKPIQADEVKNEIVALVEKLGKLDDAGKPSSPYYSYPEGGISSVLLYLSRKYQALGQTVIAGLLYEKAGIRTNEYIYPPYGESNFYGFISYFEKYAGPEDMDELLKLKHKTNKTPFEQMIIPAIWGQDEIYYDLKGTLHIRRSDFASAMEAFRKLPDNFWDTAYEFKAYLPLTSVSDVEQIISFPIGNQKKYTAASKKQVVADVLQIETLLQQAKTNQQKALYTLWLANARFNISYFGKAWMLYAYGKTSSEPSVPGDSYHFAYYYINPNNTNNTENYYYLKDARRLYEQALQLAKGDNELSARCLLMLSVCDEYQHAFDPAESNSVITGSYRSPFKKKLGRLYGKTKFFETVAVSCPDIKTDAIGSR